MLGQAARADVPVVLVMGDSLSAGYGMRADQGWVALLQRRLSESGYGYRVVNASATGETTGGGLTRLPRALEKHRPAIVIIELGGNDGLRGLDLDETRRNLDALIAAARRRGADVLLLGMQLPPNYGSAYTAAFRRLFSDAANAHGAALVPFLLDGLEHDERHFLPDGIHPNAAAQPIMLDNVWPVLQDRLGPP